MASTHNPELHDALVSAGSGEDKARTAAESVSREIRESRESAIAESGRNTRVVVRERDSENRREFTSREKHNEVADEVRENRRILVDVQKSLSWMKGAMQIMVPVLLATFAAVVVMLAKVSPALF